MSSIKPEDVHKVISKHMLPDVMGLVCDLKKSQGMYIYDSKNRVNYLDLFSFFATSPVGMNHPKMTTKEFKEKLGYVAVNKPSNSDVYTVEMAEFVETFSRIGIPEELPNLFLISGGALAVENALKTAFDWKVRKNFEKGLKEEKGHKIIHFKQAFHGRTGYTLSMTNTFDPRKTKYFPKFNWPRIINPKITFPINDENLKKVQELEQQSIDQINEVIEKEGDDIAGIIIEPIQGEGGDNHFRREFFQELRKIADENDILLIFDEVQTGVGLTGKMWAYEHFEVAPDIMAFGKKTQVCGILCSNRIKKVKNNVFEEASRINSTWGGNLVDMVRFQKYLEIIDEENLIENAEKMGNYFLNKLNNLQDNFKEKISNIRGRGLMIAFDLPTTEKRDQIRKKLYENKVLSLPCGSNSIRFRPPLIIEEKHIDEAINILHKSLKEILSD
ncbi:L-lysine 6-transaminase [candidate division KSB1 bacterium]|nr:MAG: L-lysine 6-transaminase [candidate division KSB1 bacterium]